MHISTIDWVIIFSSFAVTFLIAIAVSKQSGKSISEFFISGRSMPWWLLGVSMVATTFSADTPNLVTDIVRKNGVSGNWVWWAFLLTGMLNAFIYARLWRRSGVITALEFYELRYSGRASAFLRGFRAIYLGVFFNVLIMATVCLAGIKIGGALLGLSPVQTIIIAAVITAIYSAKGGFRGVIFTDFFQFIIAMVGTIWAAIVILNLPKVGGLSNLLVHENVVPKLDIFPDFSQPEIYIPLFLIPIAIQWWNVWYPGAEPGGGGYIAQRILAAKDEKNAIIATIFFNVAHYALRPWPWILIALASLVVFPDLESLRAAFPNLDASKIDDDFAYPAMLSYLPQGLFGLVVASLLAAFMSTISTHLNWGSSYIVNDFYKRFIDPNASEKKLVNTGRITTVGLMVLASLFALVLSNALQAFNILLQIGAGTGLIFVLRWFWWRINSYSEITAMIVSFLVAIYFEFIHTSLGFNPFEDYEKLIMGIVITTVAWLIATLCTPPTDQRVLLNFYKKIRPMGIGWKPVIQKGIEEKEIEPMQITAGQFPKQLLCMVIGCFSVYGMLFAIGNWIYGNINLAIACTAIAVGGILVIIRLGSKVIK